MKTDKKIIEEMRKGIYVSTDEIIFKALSIQREEIFKVIDLHHPSCKRSHVMNCGELMKRQIKGEE